MEIPAILKGEVHLPLKEGMIALEAINLCNMFYNTTLNPHDFVDTQVNTNTQGIYCLELISIETNEVVVNFLNKTMSPIIKDTGPIDLNPIGSAFDSTPWINAPLIVQFPQEILFLEELAIGDTASADTSYKLSTLLNSYQIIGKWVSGTLGNLCAGNFVLVYKGPESEAPAEFRNGNAALIFILKIVAGSKQGYLCLKV